MSAQIHVEYLDHMGSDLTVVNAARASFSKESQWGDPELKELLTKDADLISFLASGYRKGEWRTLIEEIKGYAKTGDDQGLEAAMRAYKRRAQHWAPFAHPQAQIRMKLPIFLARQFVKHQVGGVWSEESRRYISDTPEFYFEPVLLTRPEDIKQGAAGEVEDPHGAAARIEFATSMSNLMYQELINRYQLAPEQARSVLTLNTMTTVVWTGSLLFWTRVCNQRVDPHAQGAAQSLGRKLSDVIGPLFPYSWHELTGM